MAGSSLNDKVVDWGTPLGYDYYNVAKEALFGPTYGPNDFARLGSVEEGLATVADVFGDAVLWLDAAYSTGAAHNNVAASEPRVRNLGRGDQDAVSGAVIYGGKAVLVAGNYLTTPDAAALDLTDEIEMVVRVKCNSWATSNQQDLIGKYLPAGDQRSYRWFINLTTGSLVFAVSSDGTNTALSSLTSSAALPSVLTNGQAYWLKVTFIADTGSGLLVRFYWAEDQVAEPTSWNQLGADVTSAARSAYVGTAPLTINGISSLLDGSVYRAIVRDGIDGTTVLDVDLENVDNWATSFEATTGQTVTLTTTAAKGGAPSALDAKYGSVLGAYVYDGAAVLPGIASNYLSVPDAAAVRVTGDIELVARVQLADWTPAARQVIVARHTSTSNRSYHLAINATSGTIELMFSTTGSNYLSVASSVAPTVSNGVAYWIKATRNATTGAGNFFVAPDSPTEPTSWTRVGSADVAGTSGAISAGTSPVEIGSRIVGSEYTDGSIYRTIVRDGIDGTTVLDVDLADVADYATSFTATTGQTVTVNSTTSDTNDPLLLTHTGENYVYFPGIAGNSLQTVDSFNPGSTDEIEAEWEYGETQTTRSCPVSQREIANSSNRKWWVNWNPAGNWFSVNYRDSGGTDRQAAVAEPEMQGRAGRRFRVRYYPAAGEARFWYSDNGGAWTEPSTSPLTINSGTPWAWVTAAGVPIQIGAEGNGTIPVLGTIKYAKVSYVGVTQFEFNAATDITDAGATSFTATSGQTVTVNRATSGRKTALVTRPVWLFGTDDSLRVADNALLDFNLATDSMTALIVLRQFATPTAYSDMMSKNTSLSPTGNKGWEFRYNNVSGTFDAALGDGSGAANFNTFRAGPSAVTFGPSHVVGFKVDSGTAYSLLDNTSSAGTAGLSWDMTNTGELQVIGTEGIEVVAAAVFRRALTADEITAICQFYGTV